MTRRLSVFAVLTLTLLGACATEDPAPGGTDGTSEPAETTPAPTETAPDGLPGEPFDAGPAAGAELAVVGVAAGDTLNVRSGPGVAFDVVTELPPLTDDVVATGQARVTDEAIWVEVSRGETGWVNWRYLAYLGSTDDVTHRLGETHGQEVVEAAEAVIAQLYPDAGADWVVVDGPRNGSPGEVVELGDVVIDVLDFGDDSVLGARLHVFASPDGGAFTVRTVEVTTLCARGVADGLCL